MGFNRKLLPTHVGDEKTPVNRRGLLVSEVSQNGLAITLATFLRPGSSGSNLHESTFTGRLLV